MKRLNKECTEKNHIPLSMMSLGYSVSSIRKQRNAGLGYGPNYRDPALQAQGPEFKPQYCHKARKKMKRCLLKFRKQFFYILT
jgi:hypothetical protein